MDLEMFLNGMRISMFLFIVFLFCERNDLIGLVFRIFGDDRVVSM